MSTAKAMTATAPGTGTAAVLDSPAATRAIAISAGDLSVSVMQEVSRIMAQSGNNQAKAIEAGSIGLFRMAMCRRTKPRV